MQRISSAYNFVPLSDTVVFPAWRHITSQDIPFRDGLSGHLDVELDAVTPLLVSGKQDEKGPSTKPRRFVTGPDGKPIIPGTSLRGMLRSVVEIASFGKMGRVDDKTFGLRDLQNRFVYGQYMSEIVDRNPMPLVEAGWLVRSWDEEAQREQWQIQPCHFAKLEYGVLKELARVDGRADFDPGRKQSAPDKYRQWPEALESEYRCKVKVLRKPGRRIGPRPTCQGGFGVVDGKGAETHVGRIVMTGQPQRFDPNKSKRKGAGNPKHHDFFFYSVPGEPLEALPVDERQRGAFENVHADSGQQGRSSVEPNPEWAFWKKRSDPRQKGCKVPVFFLRKVDGSLRAFGLAMMFRLAYDLSVLELVEKTQPKAKSTEPDLGELIFGFVRPEKAEHGEDAARRGRVFIGDGRVVGETKELERPIKAVLSAPKPTYYPSYVAQRRPTYRKGEGFQWQTYMEKGKPKAGGWKRYLARREAEAKPHLPEKATERVMSQLLPLKAGTKFRFRVRFHNLRPVELGALVWAIRFGSFDDARHALGLGRSLGYGQVKLRIVEQSSSRNDGAPAPTADEAQAAFEGYMEASVPGGWKRSEQIQQLVLMARPPVDPEEEQYIRHMQLDHRTEGNEFVAAKKAGLVLGRHGTEADRARFEAEAVVPEGAPDLTGENRKLAEAEPPKPRTASSDDGALRGTPTPAPEPTPPAELPPLPDRLEVEFADLTLARDTRRNAEKRVKKGKPAKDVWLSLQPVVGTWRKDPRLASLGISSVADGMDEIFDQLRTANTNVRFVVRLEGDQLRVER